MCVYGGGGGVRRLAFKGEGESEGVENALAVVARRVPKVRVVGARAAALVARDEVSGEDEVPWHARLVKVKVGPLERRVYVLSAIIIHDCVVVRLRRVVPRHTIGGEKVRAHRDMTAEGKF